MRWLTNKLANEAAEASNTACDDALSRMYSEPFRDKFWPQQVTQVRTTTGNIHQRNYVRDLDGSLQQVVHDKHKLGLSNQKSTYCQAWQHSSPTELRTAVICFWNMPTVRAKMRRNTLNFRCGQQETGLHEETSIHGR